MDWSQEDIFKFIELFQKERIIWDPKNKFHKNNQKINDAWERLSLEMIRPINDLKNKKNSLMATFRQHLRRKKLSRTSGAGEDDIYKPVWIYYDIMEGFLASIYKCHPTINTEEGLITSDPLNVDSEIHQDINNDDHHISEQDDEFINDQNNDEQNCEKNKSLHKKKIFKSPIKRKRSREDCEADIHKNIKDTVSNLNSMLLNRKENDECDLYAQLLATRLREYSIQERRQIMHSIDGLLFANPPKQLQQFNPYTTSTPSPSSTLSSPYRPNSRNNYVLQPQQSPVQISNPDRPNSRNNYVSQPQQSPVQISNPDRPNSRNNYVSQPQQSPVQISIPDHSYSRNIYVSQPQQSPVQISNPDRPNSRNNYVSQPQQSPVQISNPDRPNSRNNYVSQPQQSPVQISNPDRPNSRNNYVSQPQQSPVQISIPDHSYSRNIYVSQPQPSPVQISTSDRPNSRNIYVSQPQQSPVQISIPDRPISRNSYIIESSPISGIIHSATATVDNFLPSQNCVTVLSQEIIQPVSENIINTALINAFNDDSY